MAKYYAVKQGKQPGVYATWSECQEQTKGYSGAEYKSFKTEEEAKEYVYGFVDKEIPGNIVLDKSEMEEIRYNLDSLKAYCGNSSLGNTLKDHIENIESVLGLR